MKYWAFISYSHRDAKTAARLQRFIETYRIPRALARADAELPSHLKPVFRDRDELQAGADLKASVLEALRESRYLIVVCSPDAAGSRWTNQEIVEFKKIHGESRVLAVIVGGEPFASREPGREREECFPEALRHALTEEGVPSGELLEPIAADMRPQGDGPRLAMLKIVAGMIGVGVNDLVRRDAQRRTRRLAMIAAGSLAGMAVMAVLTVMAVQARNDAQSQRAQAEDLLEFMLGDLRKKLVPVGRLDVLDAVGGKALAYYGRQDPDTLDANALGRRSRALHLIGEMREERGQLDDALAAFRSAAGTTAALLQRAPDDGQRVFDHAQSVYWVGHIAWLRGQAAEAEASFEEYRRLAKKLVAIDGANLDWRLETAYADQAVGVAQLERKDLDAALKSLSAARDTLEQLVAVRPALRNELADAHGWIAKTHEVAGDYVAALAAQQRRLDVLALMPNAQKDRRVQRQMSNVSFEMGRLELYRGHVPEAEAKVRAAVATMESLVATDGANMPWLADLTLARLRWIEIERAMGNGASVGAVLDVAAKDTARLLAKDPTSTKWQINVNGLLLAQQAALSIPLHREPPTAAMEAFLRRAGEVEASGKVFKTVHPEAEIVVTIDMLLGDALMRAGRGDDARKYWGAVVTRVQAAGDKAGAAMLTLLARALLSLDRSDDGRAVLARIEASNYRHPAYVELVDELRHGAGPGRSTLTRR